MERTVIASPSVPSSGKPYSPAIRHGDTVYVSGQVAYDPSTGKALAGGFDAQAVRVLDNLTALLDAAGSDRAHVIRTTCYLVDIADAPRFNEIYREYFPMDPPARSTVGVAALSPGFLVEVEAIAAVKDV
jgi:2-iminobutanoate/2-iminopropanoate deaminase